MFNEIKVLKELEQLLGKEFTLPELCESYGYNISDFAEFFFELDKENKISFVLSASGSLRLAHVAGKKVKVEQVEDGSFSFPKDIKIFKLILFSLNLPMNLRIEFDKCMAIDNFVDKFKKMSEQEIKDFLIIRAEIFKKDNEKEVKRLKVEKQSLKDSAKQKKLGQKKLSKVDKKEIKESQNKYNTNKKATVVKKKKNPKVELKRKLEIEKQRNLLKFGREETNQARKARLQREFQIEMAKQKFLERIQERKKNVRKYRVGEVVKGKIVKVIDFGVYVDIGSSDGFINVSNLEEGTVMKFAKKLAQGKEINCEITNIDLKRGNIDLVPTTIQPLREVDEKELKRVSKTINNIIDAGGKDALSFFIRLIKKNIKHNGEEWSVTLPKNKKNTIRLNNFGLEGSYINDKGIMVVMMQNNQGKSSVNIKYLIDKFVSIKNKKGKYLKIPEAVPAFLDFYQLKGKKPALFSGYCNFFEEAKKTGKNSWKNAHSTIAINQLVEIFEDVDLSQPGYIE